MLENNTSEPGGHRGISESNHSFGANMDWKCIDLYWEIIHVIQMDRKQSQKILINLAALWTDIVLIYIGK